MLRSTPITKPNRHVSRDARFQRRGTATIELAVCIPVLAIIVFGSLSATSMIFLRTAAIQSAYETIKEAVKTDGDVNLALAKGNAVLSFRNITPTSVTFDPSDVANQEPGTPITVTVQVESGSNSAFSFGPFAGRIIQVQSTMLKE